MAKPRRKSRAGQAAERPPVKPMRETIIELASRYAIKNRNWSELKNPDMVLGPASCETNPDCLKKHAIAYIWTKELDVEPVGKSMSYWRPCEPNDMARWHPEFIKPYTEPLRAI